MKNGQSRETGNIRYTRHRMKTKTLRGNQKWTIQRNWQHSVHKTQDEDPNVASFSGLTIFHCLSVLFVFVLCLEYQILPISLDCSFVIAPQYCLSSSSVLCTQCCQFLWIVHSCLLLSVVCLHYVSCVPNVASFSGLTTRQKTKTNKTEKQ
jgi:hypothetical protein